MPPLISPLKNVLANPTASPLGRVSVPTGPVSPGDGTDLIIAGKSAAIYAFNTANTFEFANQTGVVTNGTPVGYAGDLSGNGERLLQYTTSIKPTMNVIGDVEYITTDGGDFLDREAAIAAITTGTDFSVYCAFKTGTASLGFGPAWVQADGSGVDNNDRIAQFHDTGFHAYGKEGVGNTLYSLAPTVESIVVDTWYVSAFKFDNSAGQATQRINGVDNGTFSIATTINTFTGFQIFRGNLGSLLKAPNGSALAGIAIYNSLLTPEEESQVENELAAMCGISL